MTYRYVVLPRAINLGNVNKVPMARLREVLAASGFERVKTLLQSGNIVLDAASGSAVDVGAQVERVLTDQFGVTVPCVVRTPEEIRAVLAHDPLGAVATNLSWYLVTFLSDQPSPEGLARLLGGAELPAVMRVHGREVYTWAPEGVSKLRIPHAALERRLGVTGTARAWRTVTTIAGLLDD